MNCKHCKRPAKIRINYIGQRVCEHEHDGCGHCDTSPEDQNVAEIDTEDVLAHALWAMAGYQKAGVLK